MPTSTQRLLVPFLLVAAALALVVFTVVASRSTQRNGGHCEGTPDRYQCVADAAVRLRSPDLCYQLNAAQDDACMSDVYRRAGEGTICDRVPKEGVRAACFEYYRTAK